MLKFMYVLSLLLVTNAKDDGMIWEKGNSSKYRYFTSRTNYELVSAKKIEVRDGLTAQQIFTINRHGAPFQSVHNLHYMNLKLTDITRKHGGDIRAKSKLSEEDIELILNWKLNKEKDFGTGLHPKGQNDIRKLAQRIQIAFPRLFETPFNDEDYKVQSIPSDICEKTGQIFLQTIFNNSEITNIPVCDADDTTLLHKNILLYDAREVTNYIEKQIQHKKMERISEMDRFKASDIMKEVLNAVRERLGLHEYQLHDYVIFLMYDMCTYESLLTDTSIWCEVFSNHDLEVLEYVDELQTTHSVGYSNNFHPQLAVPMNTLLLETFRAKASENPTGPTGVFYFANNENVLSMCVALGLAKDKLPMTAENFTDMNGRQWRTSHFGPSAANFMAVLYKDNDGTFFVAIYLNEHLMSMKMNSGRVCDFCEWNEFEEKLDLYKNSVLFIDDK